MYADPNEIIKLADNSVFNDYSKIKIRKVKAQNSKLFIFLNLC